MALFGLRKKVALTSAALAEEIDELRDYLSDLAHDLLDRVDEEVQEARDEINALSKTIRNKEDFISDAENRAKRIKADILGLIEDLDEADDDDGFIPEVAAEESDAISDTEHAPQEG